MSEFSSTPLVMGEVYGSRRFIVSGTGGLKGPIFTGERWTSGINVAECQGIGKFSNRHKVSGFGCTCGYYAYFSHRYDKYAKANTIRAIIRGTGRVTAGSKGFRAEKAEVVAFVSDVRFPTIQRMRWKFHPVYPIVLVMMQFCLMLFGVWFAINGKFLESAILLACWGAIVKSFVAEVDHLANGFHPPNETRIERMKTLYPDIPTYHSLRAAAKDFPLTKAKDLPK